LAYQWTAGFNHQSDSGISHLGTSMAVHCDGETSATSCVLLCSLALLLVVEDCRIFSLAFSVIVYCFAFSCIILRCLASCWILCHCRGLHDFMLCLLRSLGFRVLNSESCILVDCQRFSSVLLRSLVFLGVLCHCRVFSCVLLHSRGFSCDLLPAF